MKTTDDLLLIPHAEGFRAWRQRGNTVPQPEDGTRARHAGWVALPARNVVSVPVRFQGVDSARRESAATLELEAAGIPAEHLTATDLDLLVLDEDERDQRVHTCIQIAPLPAPILDEAADARFAPSVAFRKLVAGEAQLWRECGGLVMAIPDQHGLPLHCQALSGRALDEDTAAEIRCIMAGLELAGMAPQVQSLCVITSDPTEDVVPVSFENALDLAVTVRPEEPPVIPQRDSRLVPASVVRLRQERQQRRNIMIGAAFFVLLLVLSFGVFAGRLVMRERHLAAEEARLDALEPELAGIRDAQDSWLSLGQAMNPGEYPVEIFYRLVNLLPPEGIRLTRFEINQDAIILDGEASSLGHGINFRGALVGEPFFADWGFDRSPNPTNLPDGRATFRFEGRRDGLLADNESAQ